MLRSLDSWLLNLANGRHREITRASDRGRLQTCDITPDGRQIAFDRVRENSDIVLVDRPE